MRVDTFQVMKGNLLVCDHHTQDVHACMYMFIAFTYLLVPYACRCGEALKMLFTSPTLQHFLSCTPMREANSERAIYQPGTLKYLKLLCNFALLTK